MTDAEAFDVVLDLAEKGVLRESYAHLDPALQRQRARQLKALEIIQDIAKDSED